MEGLAEGNDTASYFLPVHAESACRRYRSRPSSLALPHCRLKRERERERERERRVLAWVGLTVYTGDRVDAVFPSFVHWMHRILRCVHKGEPSERVHDRKTTIC